MDYISAISLTQQSTDRHMDYISAVALAQQSTESHVDYISAISLAQQSIDHGNSCGCSLRLQYIN